MVRIGIVGFGLMGRTHLNAYLADPRAEVIAIAEPDTARLKGDSVESNFGGDESPFDLASITHHPSLEAMLADDRIEAVSICSPTTEHVSSTIAALQAGKHVLCEKPLGLTSSEAMRAVEAAGQHPHLVSMPAMCMRFWPAWAWLRSVVANNTYGMVRSATFTRMGPMPDWAEFYKDAEQSGGAILDLHIHDADFIRFCFGDPTTVTARGYSETTEGVDHVVVDYQFTHGPAIVTAEGGWSMKPGFEFLMRYLVNFEHATARFEFGHEPELRVTTTDDKSVPVELSPKAGYDHEIVHFLDCIERGEQSTIVTMTDGAEAIRLIEAERESVSSGKPVQFAHAGATT